MRLNKFAYLYSKPLGNHTLKMMKKIPGNLLKKKNWKNHGNIMEFCQSEKVGTLSMFVVKRLTVMVCSHYPTPRLKQRLKKWLVKNCVKLFILHRDSEDFH